MNYLYKTVDFEVQDINKLHLNIYTIGYTEEGESILLLLFDGTKILHSTLIDCYSEKGYNHIDTILHNTGVKKINAFIWTHPDRDHSVGIPELLRKYDSAYEAKIFIPHGINKKESLSIESADSLNYIERNYNVNRNYKINYISLNEGEIRSLLKYKIKVHGDAFIDYSFSFILPNSNVVERRINSDEKILWNDFSIFHIVTFNNKNFVFGGDLSRQNVQFINEDWLKDTVFVKIPHHGSDTLDSFIGKLVGAGVDNAVCTCTTFKSKRLPHEQILTQYKRFSDAFFCTGNNIDTPQYDYGCISIVFNANMKDRNNNCTGNAYEFFK